MRPENWSFKSKVVIAGTAFILAAGGGAVAATAAHQDQDTTFTPAGEGPLPSEKYDVPTGTTPDGRTYGSGLDEFHGRAAYDLISVIGDSGKLGFVDRKTFESIGDDVPPEEAREFRAKVDAGAVEVPVFDIDGTTRVDTFTIGPAKMPDLKRSTEPTDE